MIKRGAISKEAVKVGMRSPESGGDRIESNRISLMDICGVGATRLVLEQ